MIAVQDTKTKNASVKTMPVKTTKDFSSIDSALAFVVPSWPLQNTVAVSPFWNLKNRDIHTVLEEVAATIHRPLYMSLEYYLDKYQSGLITDKALATALNAARVRMKSVPDHVDELVQHSKIDRDVTRRTLTFTEFLDARKGLNWAPQVSAQVSKYAAAYFDHGQAVSSFPWQHSSFWKAWLSAQEADRSMESLGIKEFKRFLTIPTDQNAENFVKETLLHLNLPSTLVETRYMRRLLATAYGWSTQFNYCQWQRSLGYDDVAHAVPLELLAVLLAYDLTIVKWVSHEDSSLVESWKKAISPLVSDEESRVHSFELHQIWQSALELTYQSQLAQQIKAPKSAPTKATYQVAMCIDVRSETLRRALESVSPQVETIGFAGFFGLPFNYKAIDEKLQGHRLPVLLPPAYDVDEGSNEPNKIVHKALLSSFFRNLRKAPLSSFAYVEIFGIYSLLKMMKSSVKGMLGPDAAQKPSKRFCRTERGPKSSMLRIASGGVLDLDAKVERAAAVLRHMGLLSHLKNSTARVVVVAGHGSDHINNAFRSSLDCGACGGHAGDINARILADLLNDSQVRQGLAKKGIVIPNQMYFVPAVHETVTDELHLLDEDKVVDSHKEDLDKLKRIFVEASHAARKERLTARSPYLDPASLRRSNNWSETRPEWGLAGNASFIVAPRSFSKSINLQGRTFLHDYDATHDDGFATLELIMTAPMLVTHWINFQYYASTVAPEFYGSGNKVIHNLVNESGVYEGNGGDLRVGLPWQSVHDGEKFVHEPLRLSVFIAAPRQAMENIIAKHETVRHLVDNGWLHLMHIDIESGVISRRRPGGLYIPVDSLEAQS